MEHYGLIAFKEYQPRLPFRCNFISSYRLGVLEDFGVILLYSVLV